MREAQNKNAYEKQLIELLGWKLPKMSQNDSRNCSEIQFVKLYSSQNFYRIFANFYT